MNQAASGLGELAALLEELGVPFVLIGGHAVNTWLEPRFTADVDLTVSADAQKMARIKERLRSAGYSVEREQGGQFPSGPDFIRFVSADGVTILEMQGAKTRLQSQVIARAVRDRGAMPVATPEDLLILKLIANRAKDQVDILGLVALAGMDWAYVEEEARDWGVVEVLQRLRGQT